eukprot:4021721-Amphidinium_carterae.1
MVAAGATQEKWKETGWHLSPQRQANQRMIESVKGLGYIAQGIRFCACHISFRDYLTVGSRRLCA